MPVIPSRFVFPYRAGSKSAIALAQSLGGKTVKLQNSKFKPDGKTLINWGSTDVPKAYLDKCKVVLNPPSLVSLASNKKKFFEAVAATKEEDRPRIPSFTFSKDTARGWLEEGKIKMIFARTVLAGHSGEGIVKITTKEELDAIANGTLLVAYVPKKREFRLHVGKKSGVFSVQEKKKKAEVNREDADYQIRNLANGFIFARNEIEVPDDVTRQAIKALAVTGLDFGAIDIIWNDRAKEAYVLEINTAPGLEGTTVEDYTTAVNRELANG